MAKRYELSDEAWTVVADLFTETHGRGRPRLSDRLMLDGVLWVLGSGAACRDMPERWPMVKRCKWLLADKGYDAEALRRYCDQYRMQPVIPMRSMERKPKPGLPRLIDRPKYRQRNIIERMFGWLKGNRRIVTRFDKLAKS